MAEATITHVRKAYGAVEVIHDLNLTIDDGKLTVLLGPSGCGKSTLLRMIAGLESITSGEIAIDGEVVNDLSPADRGCAMVFQNYALYPHKTVYKNIAFPLHMAGQNRETIDREVRRVAAVLQIEKLLDRLPRDLSGGQRQRVAMGRAMIRSPKVFLFDEPLSNLDAELRMRMRLEIANLQKSLGATMIFVTHDQVEAMTLADRIVVMKGGHVEQTGTPLEIYRNPVNRFVASFLGSPAMNFLSVTDEPGERESVLTRQLRPLAQGSGTATIGVRPEHLSIAREGGAVLELTPGHFSVTGVENLGDRSYVHLDVDGSEVTMLSLGDVPAQDSPLRLEFDPSHIHRFDRDGKAIRPMAAGA